MNPMQPKFKVLFVDDEPHILSGLRRMLRSQRAAWDMDFAEGGKAAIALMAESEYDAIVTDMRMPGVDGVQLLEEAVLHNPRAVRIILSGQADEDQVIRAVKLAHIFLSKPCEPEQLIAAICNARSLDNIINIPALKGIVSRIKSFPCLPRVYHAIVTELQSEEASIKNVADLVSQDLALTAKLLQLVNSSFFGLPRRIECPAQAASLLGLKILKPLILSSSVFCQFDADRLRELPIDQLLERSLLVGKLAEQLAVRVTDDKQVADDALIAGILHDFGLLILATEMPEQYQEVIRLADSQSCSILQAEYDCIGVSHAELGAYLLGLWQLPKTIVDAVAWHHRPSRSRSNSFTPLTALHIANAFVSAHFDGVCADVNGDSLIDVEYLRNLGLEAELPRWRSDIEAFLAKHEERACAAM
jgi:HD-like signal output (HDOD) protein